MGDIADEHSRMYGFLRHVMLCESCINTRICSDKKKQTARKNQGKRIHLKLPVDSCFDWETNIE